MGSGECSKAKQKQKPTTKIINLSFLPEAVVVFQE